MMRRNIWQLSFFLLGLTFFSLLQSSIAWSTTNDKSLSKYTFRGIDFGSAPLENMEQTDVEGYKVGVGGKARTIKEYRLKNEDMSIGDITVNSITYFYLDSQLFKIVIEAPPQYKDYLDTLLATKFGTKYKRTKFKEVKNNWTLLTKGKMLHKKVLLPDYKLIIDVLYSFSQTTGGSVSITYTDIELGKTFAQLQKEESIYDAKQETLRQRKVLQDSGNQV